jgi:hypothetical protein
MKAALCMVLLLTLAGAYAVNSRTDPMHEVGLAPVLPIPEKDGPKPPKPPRPPESPTPAKPKAPTPAPTPDQPDYSTPSTDGSAISSGSL